MICVKALSLYFDCFEARCVMFEMDESNFVKKAVSRRESRETRGGTPYVTSAQKGWGI